MTIIETISKQVPNTKEGKEYLQLWLKSKEGNEFVAVDWYEDHHGITMSETVWLEGYGRGHDKNASAVTCAECKHNESAFCMIHEKAVSKTGTCGSAERW